MEKIGQYFRVEEFPKLLKFGLVCALHFEYHAYKRQREEKAN